MISTDYHKMIHHNRQSGKMSASTNYKFYLNSEILNNFLLFVDASLFYDFYTYFLEKFSLLTFWSTSCLQKTQSHAIFSNCSSVTFLSISVQTTWRQSLQLSHDIHRYSPGFLFLRTMQVRDIQTSSSSASALAALLAFCN